MSILRTVNASQLKHLSSGRRAFHSPFAFLSNPSSAPTPSTQQNQAQTTSHAQAQSPQMQTQSYEKQAESWAEPSGFIGQRFHVVSDPDPDYHPYAVPIGAYPASEPYAQ